MPSAPATTCSNHKKSVDAEGPHGGDAGRHLLLRRAERGRMRAGAF